MRIAIFLLFVGFLQTQATDSYSQNTKLSISVSNTELVKVLDKIENQSEFYFLYNEKLIDATRKVSIEAKEEGIEDVLKNLFSGTDVEYSIIDRKIILAPAYLSESQQSNKKINGKVTDQTGASLPGASVIVKGTTVGVITDNSGNYSLSNVPENAILQFSFVGMKMQEIFVGSKTAISVTLVEDAIGLEEVVAIGYGTKAKGALTGAISKVDNKAFESRPVTNTVDALQGIVPGVTITKGSGRPGREDFSLQVRGSSSINGNQPLVLIDGIPGDINTINTNDIANITVLKDASASIYGARAADGVILVTTKKGKKGEPTLSYSVNYGVKVPSFLNKTVNTLQAAEMLDEGNINIGHARISPDVFVKIKANAPPDNLDLKQTTYQWIFGAQPNFYGYTDWMKVLYGNSNQQMHNLSLSGGGENNTYLLSLGFNKNDGLINYGDNKYKKYNVRLNYDFKLFDNRLNIETNTTFDNSVLKEPSQLDNAMYWGPKHHPWVPMYNSVGEYFAYQSVWTSPDMLVNGGEASSNTSQIMSNIKGELKIVEGLKFVSQAAVTLVYNNSNRTDRTYTDNDWFNNVTGLRNSPNDANFSNSKMINRNIVGYLNYSKVFGSSHTIDLMIGTSHEENEYEMQSTTGYNYPTNDLFTLNLADRTKTAYSNFTGRLNDWALQSYFARFSYSYQNKAFLDVTTRLDGSSKFAPEKRWSAAFPALALAYNLSEEEFIKSMNVFNLLKIRASWGMAGNQEISSLGLYDYISLISLGGTNVLGSPNVGLPGATQGIASKSRTWETITNKNIGIDLTLLRSRLNFSFDYFMKTNDNMLVNVAVPRTFGGTPPSLNQGKLETKGFETSLTWKDKINDFHYSFSFQISDAKNRLVKLENSDSYGMGLNYVREGYPINSWFGMDFAGIIKTQEQLNSYTKLKGVPAGLSLGDVMFKDVDGDGEITYFGDKTKGLSGDMVYLGSNTPRYLYSTKINFEYKGFDLELFLQGVGKRKTMYTGSQDIPYLNIWFDPSEYFYGKTWTPDRPNATFPRLIPGNVGFDVVRNWDYRVSSMTMDNVSYIRAKLITLGYTLPKSITSRIKMKSARIYLSGQNLFTISKGTRAGTYDPEDAGARNSTYPYSKVYSIGLDIKF